MDKKEIQEYLEKGYIRVKVLFEIIGNPKDHINKTIRLVTDAVKKEPGIELVSEEYGDAEETEGGLFGAYCESDLLVKNLNSIAWLCFNFVPASIEIISPSKLEFKDKQFTDFLGDLISQLHNTNTSLIKVNSDNMALQRNINAIIRNAILIAIGNKELTAGEIGKIIGIFGKEIDPVLEAMIKEGRIEKKGTKFKLVKKSS